MKIDKNKTLQELVTKIKNSWNIYSETAQNMAVDTLEYEYSEMENIFGLLVLGSFIGFPSPPMQITLDLLPEMEKHLKIMINKVDTAESPLSDLFATFGVL